MMSWVAGKEECSVLPGLLIFALLDMVTKIMAYSVFVQGIYLMLRHFVKNKLSFLRRNKNKNLNCEIERLVAETGIEFDEFNYTDAMKNKELLDFVFVKILNKEFKVNISNFTSMISRCIENNLDRQLLIAILKYCKKLNISGPLYLRHVGNTEHLTLAANYGFHDPELTKRIILLQRKLKKTTFTYDVV